MTNENEQAQAGTEEGNVGVVEQDKAAEGGQEKPAEEGQEKQPEKLSQQVEIKDVGPCKKHIRVAIDRGNLDKRLNAKFSELVVDSNVAGFRPGKAPRKIIERRFSKEVTDQVKAEVLLQSLEQLAEEHDIAPLSAPNLDPFNIAVPKEGPLVYEFEVEVRPQFDLPNYRGLRLRRPVRTFADDDVAREARRLLAPYGQVVPKPEGDAQVGDVLVCDIISRDGTRVLGEMKEVMVRVDPRLAFKDGIAEHFGEQMAGANPGDQRTVAVKLSSATADPSLRGKTVQSVFHVKDVKTVRQPELTHEFLHNFGVHSPEQFNELVRALLHRRLEYQQRQAARQQVMQQIAASSTWDLPEDLLRRQARKALARRVMEMRAEGIPEDEIRNRQRLLQNDILESTALALKEHFVLQKIAEVEKIDVDEDDLQREIERIAEQNDESPRRVRARLEKEDMMDALAAELIERKALDLILQSAEYDDVPMAEDGAALSMVEQQAVPGEMTDPTEVPPEAPPTEAPPTEAPPTAAEGEQAEPAKG